VPELTSRYALWYKDNRVFKIESYITYGDLLRAVGDAFQLVKRYTNFAELIAHPEVDAVHINSPIPDHGWQTIAALKAGKHVA